MSNIQITIYETATGEVDQARTVEDTDIPTMEVGFSYILGFFPPEDFYVSGGVAVDRPEVVQDGSIFTAENDNVAVTLATSMPIGTLVICNETGQEFTSAVIENLEVQSQIDGIYTFQILPPFPYKDSTIQVNIGAFQLQPQDQAS